MNQLDWHCKRVNQKLLVLSVFVTEFSLWKMNNEKESAFSKRCYSLFFFLLSLLEPFCLYTCVTNWKMPQWYRNATFIEMRMEFRFDFSTVLSSIVFRFNYIVINSKSNLLFFCHLSESYGYRDAWCSSYR